METQQSITGRSSSSGGSGSRGRSIIAKADGRGGSKRIKAQVKEGSFSMIGHSGRRTQQSITGSSNRRDRVAAAAATTVAEAAEAAEAGKEAESRGQAGTTFFFGIMMAA